MALKKNTLLEQLDQLRDQIRLQEASFGVNAFVCSDDALKDIAKRKPLKLSDFHAISGLDEKFIEKYAQDFLNIILKYSNETSKTVKVSKKAYQVLYRYKDRLSDLSKNNRNLYLGRVDQTHTFDLSMIENYEEILPFLWNKRTKQLKIVTKDQKHVDYLVKLYREVNKQFKETGIYQLYINYLFVEGYIAKEKFLIKAPLIYIPVILERTLKTFTIKKDLDKDILLNRDLLLYTSKLGKSTIDQDLPTIEELNESIINSMIIPFYQKHGLPITQVKSFEVKSFESMTKDEYMHIIDKKAFHIKPFITLSNIGIFSSSIQKDMEEILKNQKYNDLLEGLIDEKDLFEKDQVTQFKISNDNVDEENLMYINDLNYSQEKVIELLDKYQKLVIWGPPGTGKSQTITSLIAKSILRGDNVLVISEKKVALDVIYSRLKNASKYAMKIDDHQNKNDFYENLKQFINPLPPVRTLNNDQYELDRKIDKRLDELDKVIDLLFKNNGQISLDDLYVNYLQDREIQDDLTPTLVFNLYMKYFKIFKYNELKFIESELVKEQTFKQFVKYQSNLTKYPILKNYQVNLSRSDKKEYLSFLEDLKEKVNQKLSFFKKRKLIKNNIETLKQFKLLKKNSYKQLSKALVRDQEFIIYLYETVNNFNVIQQKFEELKNSVKTFIKMIVDENALLSIKNQEKKLSYLFKAIYTGYIENQLSMHQKTINTVENYHDMMQELKSLMDEKRNLSYESFEMALYKNALNLNNTKRIMDIKRILDSQQRPSIKAFMEIFEVEMLNHIRLWMMTPEVLSGIMPLRAGMFDVVIFDEASQMYVEKGIPAIYRAKKVVIAGDPKQLRPSSLGSGRIFEEDELFEEETMKDVSFDAKSLLDLARFKYHETLLNYHYRSQFEELILFSNHAFYDGNLIVSPNRLIKHDKAIEYVYVPNGKFIQKKNLNEAKKVVDIVKIILKNRKNNESIGIITFNSSQRDLIHNLIDKETYTKGQYQELFQKELIRKDDDEDKSLFIKNIENVQGDERDIIIFSMGYGKDESNRVYRRFGWLNQEGGENRLNVAITRAKKKIYFVSSLYPEEFEVDDLMNRGPKLLKDFMRYCYFISNQNYQMAQSILNELHEKELNTQKVLKHQLATDLKQRLKRNGLEVDENIGIGQYRIDLAIKNNDQTSYDLAILTHMSPNAIARKDFLHQEKFLESRGWKVYRVFSTTYYENPSKIVREIKNHLRR